MRNLFSILVCSWVIGSTLTSPAYATENDKVTLETTISRFKQSFLSLKESMQDWPVEPFSYSDDELTTLGLDPLKVARSEWKVWKGKGNTPLFNGIQHITATASIKPTEPTTDLTTLWKEAILNAFAADVIAQYGPAEVVEVDPGKYARKASSIHKAFTHSFENGEFETFSGEAARRFLRIGRMHENNMKQNNALDNYCLGLLMLRLPILHWQPVGKINRADPHGKPSKLHFESTGLVGVKLFEGITDLIANNHDLRIKNMSRLYFSPFSLPNETLLGSVLWQIQLYEWAGDAQDREKKPAIDGEFFYPFAREMRPLYEKAGALAEAFSHFKKGEQKAHALKYAHDLHLGLCWILKKRKQSDEVQRLPLSAWSDIHDSSEGEITWIKVRALAERAHEEYVKTANELAQQSDKKFEAADLYFSGIHMLVRLSRTPAEGLVDYLRCYNLVQEGIKLFEGVKLKECPHYFENPFGDIRFPLGGTRGNNLAHYTLNRLYNALWASFVQEMEISFQAKAAQPDEQIVEAFLANHPAAVSVLGEGFKEALLERLNEELAFQRDQIAVLEASEPVELLEKETHGTEESKVL